MLGILVLASGLNSEPVKYAIVALTAPLWIPFVRSLYRTLDDALRDEGGLFGEAPSPEKLREIDRERGPAKGALTSTPIDEHGIHVDDAQPARSGPTKPRGF
jgi:hypothetical protein